MASYFWREIFYVPLPGTPGKIPGNSGSTELRKEFGTTLPTTTRSADMIDILSEFVPDYFCSKSSFNLLAEKFYQCFYSYEDYIRHSDSGESVIEIIDISPKRKSVVCE